MSETLAYVFECGHEGTEVGRTNRKITCPICSAHLVKKKYRCQNEECRKEFYHSKNGTHMYCPECTDIIKRSRESNWQKKHWKDRDLKRPFTGMTFDEVHDKVDCIHRSKCLMNRITLNPDICLTCDEYESEFNAEARYYEGTGADTFSTHANGGYFFG